MAQPILARRIVFYCPTLYDALHVLAETLITFNNIKAKTHDCLFSYVCVKYPELELDFGFFEKVRTLRNGSIYYGRRITFDDWKQVELQLGLYIQTIQKAIGIKL